MTRFEGFQDVQYCHVLDLIKNGKGRIIKISDVASDTELMTKYIKYYIDSKRVKREFSDVEFSNDYLKIRIDVQT